MSDTSNGFLDGVLDRTISNLRAAWRDISSSARGFLGTTAPSPELPPDDAERLLVRMRECLDARGGEVSARARAADLGRSYLALNSTGRERFLRLLADEFEVDVAAVDAACARLAEVPPGPERRPLERALRDALEAPRVRLLTQFNGLKEGVKFLVDMRGELMGLAKGDVALTALDDDLRRLLAGWFDIGFLELRRITWDAPAALLEKLIVYEAVHEIRSWTDLKNRLEADRRCFAFFHPRMPDEPLIFVEVALVRGIAGNVQKLLDEAAPVEDPGAADTAIFYSISNCQKGLAGISFGNFLIKRVVDLLAAEHPDVKTYATLSPIPGFKAWLDKRMAEDPKDILLPAEKRTIEALPSDLALLDFPELLAIPGWHERPDLAEALRTPLMRLAAHYLTREKGRGGRARDPVAHFHLANGARVERLDWLGDTSRKGIQQSAGLMINYLYRLSDIEDNHEAYSGEGKVAVSSGVRSLLKA